MTVLRGAREGVLQFGNFLGESELGGRKLIVRSRRLTTGAVQRMLDEVADELASLPFAAKTPTVAPYARTRGIAVPRIRGSHAYAEARERLNS